MDTMILFGLRVALLVLLWLFILFALNVQRKDTKNATASSSAGGNAALVPAVVAPLAASKRGGKPRLITIVDGPLTGSRMELGQLTEITVGRSPDCDFVVGDDFASARHAKLIKRGSEWFVEDLDSRNGTFVSGMRIDQPEKVSVGTDVKVGRTTVRLVP